MQGDAPDCEREFPLVLALGVSIGRSGRALDLESHPGESGAAEKAASLHPGSCHHGTVRLAEVMRDGGAVDAHPEAFEDRLVDRVGDLYDDGIGGSATEQVDPDLPCIADPGKARLISNAFPRHPASPGDRLIEVKVLDHGGVGNVGTRIPRVLRRAPFGNPPLVVRNGVLVELSIYRGELAEGLQCVPRELRAADPRRGDVYVGEGSHVPPAETTREPADRLVQTIAEPDEVATLEALESSVETLVAALGIKAAHDPRLPVAEVLVGNLRLAPDDLVDGELPSQPTAGDEPFRSILTAVREEKRAREFGGHRPEIRVRREHALDRIAQEGDNEGRIPEPLGERRREMARDIAEAVEIAQVRRRSLVELETVPVGEPRRENPGCGRAARLRDMQEEQAPLLGVGRHRWASIGRDPKYTRAMSRPLISVLLPLQDQRETAVASVTAWTDQSADPAAYEILALAPGEDAEMEEAVRPLLRDADRWLVRPGRDEYELFNIGADAAHGEFLFLTEAHCVPEHDCLQAMIEELGRTDAPGVRGNSVPDLRGPLGELELEMFDEAQKQEEDPGHWRKVLIHSLTLRRDLFLEAGGTPSRYGDFCTWVLAIALDQRGARLAYSPRPRVRHTYDGDLDHVEPFVRSFRRGEVLYRSEHPPEALNEYLPAVPEWESRLAYTRSGAVRALRARVALRHRGALSGFGANLASAILGPRAEIVRCRVRAAAAARRARKNGNAAARKRAFIEFWQENSRRGTLEGLAETEPALPEPRAASELDLTGSCAGLAIGLHNLEDIEGEPPFRWTAPVALFRVAVPGRGPMPARLQLWPFVRPLDARPAAPRITVDNCRVPIRVTDEAVEFQIDPGEHWIAIACNPLHPERHGVDDPRALGLPVRSLVFEPAGAETGR